MTALLGLVLWTMFARTTLLDVSRYHKLGCSFVVGALICDASPVRKDVGTRGAD